MALDEVAAISMMIMKWGLASSGRNESPTLLRPQSFSPLRPVLSGCVRLVRLVRLQNRTEPDTTGHSGTQPDRTGRRINISTRLAWLGDQS
eukprot:scaffold127566_cov40-Cyclotella_meneghiniana.AAC.2